MLRKNLKTIITLFSSLIIAIVAISIDGQSRGGFIEILQTCIFSICLVISFNSGFSLYFEYTTDRELRKQPSGETSNEFKNHSGKIEIIENQLVFYYSPDDKNTVDLKTVKVIGEMTTEADPVMIDWYLVLVDTSNEEHYLPAYATGFDSALSQLSEYFQSDMTPKLASSIHFKSNILYPTLLAGQDLLEFDGLSSKNFWTNLKIKAGIQPVTSRLKKEIKDFQAVD